MKSNATILIIALFVLCFLAPLTGFADTVTRDKSSVSEAPDIDKVNMKRSVFENYFALRSSLAADSMRGVPEKAASIATTVDDYLVRDAQKQKGSLEKEERLQLKKIADSARALARKGTIDEARSEFAELSKKLVVYQHRFVRDDSERAVVFACDMAKAVWLQEEEEPGNPYYGSAMLRCARKIE